MSALLREYHRRHDERDWAGLASLFRLDGELAIHGPPHVRARGPADIERLFLERGPDDGLVLGPPNEHVDGSVSATYGWRRDAARIAGEIYLLPEGNAIQRFDVYPLPAGAVVPEERLAVRALVVAPGSRVLLFRCQEPGKRGWWWITPGGGQEAGEDDTDTLRRELLEEVGIAVANAGPCVWTRTHTFVWRDRAFRQHERFHLLEVREAMEPAPRIQDEGLTGHRWWSLDELRSTREILVPRELGPLLETLLRDGPPAVPFEVP
jgi:8-oxo-dGTP pyrophosphatase MutT (NUDIX family)